MQKRPIKVRIIVLLAMSALLMGAFFIAPGAVKAQGGARSYDFSQSDWSWHSSGFGRCEAGAPPVYASYQTGVGWRTTDDPGATRTLGCIWVYPAGGANYTITGVRVVGHFSAPASTAFRGVIAEPGAQNIGFLPTTSGNFDVTFSVNTTVQQLAVVFDTQDSYGPNYIYAVYLTVPPYYTPVPLTTLVPDLPTCTMPDTRSASFRPGQQWAFNGGADYAVPLPQQFLRLPPGGSASMSVNLSDAEYKLQVVYQSSGLGGGSFVASVGGLPYTIQPADSAEHTFETEPIQYPTGATTLGLSKPATDSVDVVIKFFCLSAVQGSGSGAITTGGDKNDQCETCDPPISITDIPGILNWLLCNIRRLWTCYLLPILTNILSFIGTIIKFILSFFGWIVRGIGDILNWVAGLISSVWGSITGWISNLFAGVNNDFHSSGIADDMNIAASRTRDLPTAIGNGISTLGGQLSQIFTNTGQGLGGFTNFIWRLINFGASAIAYVIGLIPLVIQSFVDGINSASTPPSGSPLCSNPASLAYYPCLGFYVLDNTIFAGPAGYLFPVLIGIIVFYNLVWIFTRIKEELSK
jgi:hypothetical protein